MSFKKELTVLSLSIISLVTAQDQIALPNQVLSDPAFSELVESDFNFLLFGESSPAQGVSLTKNDKGTEINLSGNLYTFERALINATASFKSSDGIYLFDQNGSDKANIQLSFIFGINSNYKYSPIKKRRALLTQFKNYKIIEAAKRRLDSVFYELVQFQDNSFIVNKNESHYSKAFLNYSVEPQTKWSLRDQVEESIEYIDLQKKLYALCSEHLTATSLIALKSFQKGEQFVSTKKVRATSNPNQNYEYQEELVAVLDKYEKIKIAIEENLSDQLIKNEINTSSGDWNGKHHFFASAHPFYTRETLAVYDLVTNKVDSERGDLFGLTIYPINWYYKGLRNNPIKVLRNTSFFLRTGYSLNRVSNRQLFSERLVQTLEPVVGTNDQTTLISSQDAFISDHPYDYGYQFEASIDVYLYPMQSVIGLFCQLSYSRNEYGRETGIEDFETIPFRSGLLINFINKKKPGEAVVLQVFADLEDFNRTTEELGDWRFGIGVGLPISF